MDWSRLQGKAPKKKKILINRKVYWWADGFYAISISVFAISVIEKTKLDFPDLSVAFYC